MYKYIDNIENKLKCLKQYATRDYKSKLQKVVLKRLDYCEKIFDALKVSEYGLSKASGFISDAFVLWDGLYTKTGKEYDFNEITDILLHNYKYISHHLLKKMLEDSNTSLQTENLKESEYLYKKHKDNDDFVARATESIVNCYEVWQKSLLEQSLDDASNELLNEIEVLHYEIEEPEMG